MGKSDPNNSPSQLRDRDGATVPAALGTEVGSVPNPVNVLIKREYLETNAHRRR